VGLKPIVGWGGVLGYVGNRSSAGSVAQSCSVQNERWKVDLCLDRFAKWLLAVADGWSDGVEAHYRSSTCAAGQETRQRVAA
jgi:hypothetical protein